MFVYTHDVFCVCELTRFTYILFCRKHVTTWSLPCHLIITSASLPCIAMYYGNFFTAATMSYPKVYELISYKFTRFYCCILSSNCDGVVFEELSSKSKFCFAGNRKRVIELGKHLLLLSKPCFLFKEAAISSHHSVLHNKSGSSLM